MKLIVVALLISSFLSIKAEAAPELLDSVSVIVDQGVVLESQITELIAVVKLNAVLNNQSLPSDRALRTQAIEKLIIDNLQTQMAERMGIQISDPQLEQTILNIAQGENMKIAQFREKALQFVVDNVFYHLHEILEFGVDGLGDLVSLVPHLFYAFIYRTSYLLHLVACLFGYRADLALDISWNSSDLASHITYIIGYFLYLIAYIFDIANGGVDLVHHSLPLDEICAVHDIHQ